MNNQNQQISNDFWNEYEDLAKWRYESLNQNDYPVSVRLAFTSYLDELSELDIITEEISDTCTLTLFKD